MRLHEYQAKRIVSQYGVPVPRGQVAASIDEVRQIANRLGKRVVLKAQVLTGGRGRAGGILLANAAAEAERLASEMFGMNIGGYMASKVLVDEAIEVEQEIYLGIAIDLGAAQPVIVASAQGGVEIAEVDRDTPEHVYRIPIDPLLGLRVYQVRELADDIGLSREQLDGFAPIALGLYRAFADCDATLVEANPLVVCSNGEFVSLNTRMLIDDNALYRHRDLIDMRDESQETVDERLARRHNISYVRLGGYVGCLSNGAGLAMATTDLLRQSGVRPANFVDIGKGAGEEKVARGLRFALSNSVRAALVNIFSSVTYCDEVARGILSACRQVVSDVPVVVRLEGTNKRAGHALLTRAVGVHRRIHVADSLGDAVRQVVDLVRDDR